MQNINELIHITINVLFRIHMAAGAIFVIQTWSIHTKYGVWIRLLNAITYTNTQHMLDKHRHRWRLFPLWCVAQCYAKANANKVLFHRDQHQSQHKSCQKQPVAEHMCVKLCVCVFLLDVYVYQRCRQAVWVYPCDVWGGDWFCQLRKWMCVCAFSLSAMC